ncbi:hypothetical protein V496_00891 [Pseudogymnoascus sp. VKM F-4515 (FW-2607)]|nr:hypothetical protein V496_00891 [Pseudogymnoascus sp. VKM F-4515 (FW-2607)]
MDVSLINLTSGAVSSEATIRAAPNGTRSIRSLVPGVLSFLAEPWALTGYINAKKGVPGSISHCCPFCRTIRAKIIGSLSIVCRTTALSRHWQSGRSAEGAAAPTTVRLVPLLHLGRSAKESAGAASISLGHH